MKSIVFTVCNLNYLDKAYVLANSVFETSNLHTAILIFDRKQDIELDINFIHLFWIEDFARDEFKFLAFKYNVIELSTAYKPYFAEALLDSYDRVIFLDPDIKVYSNLEIVLEMLERDHFLLTPHLLSLDYNYSENLNLQKFGFYNLGFFAFKRSTESIEILRWWWEQNKNYCFIETHMGAFDDQAWMSLAFHYFPAIKQVTHFGMNVGWWNFKERKIEIDSPEIKVNGLPLIFFHFSNYGGANLITKRKTSIGINREEDLKWLAQDYGKDLANFKVKSFNKTYSYDYFDDGSYINPLMRRAYASNYRKLEGFGDPFKKPKGLREYLKKNYLNSRGERDFSGISYDQQEKYSFYIRVFAKTLRGILFMFGPNRFFALNRLMTYASSLINFKELWKI